MDAPPNLTILPLGTRPDLIPTTVAWHLDAFEPDGDPARWTRARTEEARLTGIPCAWVAFDEKTPVGIVSLVEYNMDPRRDLSPWLAALFVVPSHRGRGIGSALVRRCEQEAWTAGVDRLYLHTSTAKALYERSGWLTLAEEDYEGERVTVMFRVTP